MCLRSPVRLACPRETQANTFSGGTNGKESACNAGDLGLVPGLGRSPGEGNGYTLQYSGLENSMDRRACQAIQSMGSQTARDD